MKWLLIPMVVLLLSCSSTTIVEKPYPVYLPGIHDTIPLVQDTIYLPSDTNAYWEGNVEDSLKNVIGWMKVYYNRKIAELKLNPRIDTLMITDTLTVSKGFGISGILERILMTLITTMPFWQKLIVIIGLIGTLFIIYKIWKKPDASN